MSLVVAFASVHECMCLPCLEGLLSYLLESLGLQFSSNMKIFSAVLPRIIFLSPLFTFLSPRTLVTHILEYLENHQGSVFIFLFLCFYFIIFFSCPLFCLNFYWYVFKFTNLFFWVLNLLLSVNLLQWNFYFRSCNLITTNSFSYVFNFSLSAYGAYLL